VFAPITETPDALNLDVIEEQLAQIRSAANEARKCKNGWCGKRLTSLNKDKSGLCFVCQRNALDPVDSESKKPPLKQLNNCIACGNLLGDTGAKLCRKCLNARSEVLASAPGTAGRLEATA
jgi:hypothetical protein